MVRDAAGSVPAHAAGSEHNVSLKWGVSEAVDTVLWRGALLPIRARPLCVAGESYSYRTPSFSSASGGQPFHSMTNSLPI